MMEREEERWRRGGRWTMGDGRDVSVYKETIAARPTRLRESEIAK
jgi:hypothetical protein